MYVRVYSREGEMFEVTRERADHLLLIEGWTQTAPRDAEPEDPKPDEAARKRGSRSED
jgi:hypothetical protein